MNKTDPTKQPEVNPGARGMVNSYCFHKTLVMLLIVKSDKVLSVIAERKVYVKG